MSQEEDGRWIAEVEAMPRGLGLRRDSRAAIAHVEAPFLRCLVDRLENSEPAPELRGFFSAA